MFWTQDSTIWLITIFLSAGYVSALFNPQKSVFIIMLLFYIRPMEKGLYPYPIMMVGLLVSMFVLVAYSKPYSALKNPMRTDTKYFVIMQLYLLFNVILFNRWNIVWVYQVYFIPAIIIFLLISEYVITLKNAKTLLFTIGISCLVICADSLNVHFNEDPGSYVWKIYHLGSRLQNLGFWENANILGYISNLGMGCFYIAYTLSKSSFKKFYYLSGLIFLPTIFLTGSRGALLQTVVFVAVVFMQSKKSLKVMLSLSFLIFVALTYLTVLSPERQHAEGSTNERLDILMFAKNAFLEHPLFGVGYGLFSEYNPYRLVSHNTFAQLFSELGIVGAIIFFIMLKKIFSGCLSTIKNTNGKDDLADINKLSVGVFALSTSAFVYYLFGNQLLNFIFFTIIALLVMVRRVYEKEMDDRAVLASS